MSAFDDISESPPPQPVDQGHSAITIPLAGINALGTTTRFIKHWHLFQMPEDDLSELSLTFVDMGDGTIDTDE